MKPVPDIPGNTEAEPFDNALRKVLTVSKTALLKEEAKIKVPRAKARKHRNAFRKTA